MADTINFDSHYVIHLDWNSQVCMAIKLLQQNLGFTDKFTAGI